MVRHWVFIGDNNVLDIFMKSRIGTFFFLALMAACVIAVDLVTTHLMLPPEKIGTILSTETYHLLIVKWFLAGLVLGLMIMFFMVESWIWKNWKSWNKFCCDHHEKVYQSTMGISQGKMLRR